MPAARTKIITKLRERRQIEADLRELFAAGSEAEFRRRVQEVASLGSAVLPALVANLEGADSRRLAALGAVAASLDHDEVTQTLREVVLQPQSTDRARLAAMTILERYLGEPPDDHLLAGLADPEQAALSSLNEVLDQTQHDPATLIEYVEGLDRQEPDVVLTVVRALRAAGTAQTVELLRMMALDVRAEIAAAALDALGALRLPEAVAALQSLLPIIEPELGPQARRLLRKLQFIGLEVRPLPSPAAEWRALIGAVDGLGQRQVWHILENHTPPGSHKAPRRSGYARFLNVLLSDQAGAARAIGHMQVPVAMLPPRRTPGAVHQLPLPDGSGAILMVEAPFGAGRRLVAEALAVNRQTQIPIAGPLRLLVPWLWGVDSADPAPVVPAGFAAEELAGAGRLLGHPAFVGWTVRGDPALGASTAATAIVRAAEEAARRPDWDLEVWVRRMVAELLAEPAVRRVLSRRLSAMSEWLLLAGQESFARLAAASAQAIQEQAPGEQMFLQSLVRQDLQLTINVIWQGAGPA